MKQEMSRISHGAKFSIEHLETDKDPLHMLISSTPNVSITQIVRKLKQESTIAIWKQFPLLLNKHFWKEKTFWTDGYFASTTGQSSEEMGGDILKIKDKRRHSSSGLKVHWFSGVI